MSDTYLKVSFRERDTVKSLGARFDWDRKQWFVPAGRDLAPFASWLPETTAASTAERELVATDPSERSLDPAPRGVPLSRLLSGVAAAVAQAYASGVWTTAEVLQAREVRGHWFLELAERLATGEVVAKSNAVIWARNAPRLITAFQQETGAALDAGIKVLLRAKPSFTPEHGFILVVDEIDASYTLGDLEARKREIRARLQADGLFARNKALPAPWDFARILVVAPERGAGLGDFAKEAERLARHGVLTTVYVHCRFQGEGAAAEIREALQGALQRWNEDEPPDAVVIIRGGGAVNDLAWLNDYALARFICECPHPVLTGIGHERDGTVLDEVAHQKFDTPSKVVAGIEQLLARRVREARESYDGIISRAVRDLERSAVSAARLDEQVRALARETIGDGRAQIDTLLADCRLGAAQSVPEARSTVRQRLEEIRSTAFARLATARQTLPTLLTDVHTAAFTGIAHVRTQMEATLPAVLDRAAIDVGRAGAAATGEMAAVSERATATIQAAASQSEALMREVAGQGPDKTVARGFAIVSSKGGRSIGSLEQLGADTDISVRFRDGSLTARVGRTHASTDSVNQTARNEHDED